MNSTSHRRALVTGGANGLGLETARALAQSGYAVIIADRNVAAGEQAVESIRESGGTVEFRSLDLGSLAAIHAFASDEMATDKPLDLLINNAGLLPPARRTMTADGFELALGVAFLGHFALTALLLPMLLRSPIARVVSVSSNSHPSARLDFDDLHLQRNYRASTAYANSKFACASFGFELQHRINAVGVKTLTSVVAHPGISRTTIGRGWQSENRRKLWDRVELLGFEAFTAFFDRSAAEGARSLIHAATAPQVEPGGYYGPVGFMQARGEPGRVKPSPRALDRSIAARLWQAAEEQTQVRWQWP
jgi:NAD(P)-dependent dehydrogenase (short-subunit alcohol dehydrogenase family)